MEPGRVLSGRYELEHEIGSGGAAMVWRAHDRSLHRTVAVKMLHPGLDRDEDTVARFRREARSAASLNHRNAVAIYDIGSDDDESFIVMELVDGPSLGDVLDGRPLVAEAACAVGYQVASALGAAHDHGLIHRDIKPANILLSPEGQTKVADFGIAKAVDAPSATLTQAGTVVGTVAYLAPEQIRGDDVDPRADVYALGLVLHEALTGEPPFGRGTPAEVTARRLASDPPPLGEARPDLPDDLVAAITRATRLDADARFVDGGEFAATLEELLGEEPHLAIRRLARLGDDGRGEVQDATQVLAAVTPAQADETVPIELPDETSVPPVIPDRPEDRDPIVPEDARRPILAVLVLVAAILGAWSIFGADEDPNGGGGGGDGSDEPRAIEVANAQDFDPFGDDGEEHADEVGNAHDGDPGTAWRTSRYDSADMGGLKPGVGIWFDLGAAHDVASIELTVSPGIDLEVYLTEDEPGDDPDGWGEQLDAISGAPESASIEVPEDISGRYVLVWVTSVGGAGGRAEVAEIRVLAR